jgi:hypothetical protein
MAEAQCELRLEATASRGGWSMWTGAMTVRERAAQHLSQLRPAPRRRLIEVLDGTGQDGYLALHFENGRLKAFVADRVVVALLRPS